MREGITMWRLLSWAEPISRMIPVSTRIWHCCKANPLSSPRKVRILVLAATEFLLSSWVSPVPHWLHGSCTASWILPRPLTASTTVGSGSTKDGVCTTTLISWIHWLRITSLKIIILPCKLFSKSILMTTIHVEIDLREIPYIFHEKFHKNFQHISQAWVIAQYLNWFHTLCVSQKRSYKKEENCHSKEEDGKNWHCWQRLFPKDFCVSSVSVVASIPTGQFLSLMGPFCRYWTTTWTGDWEVSSHKHLLYTPPHLDSNHWDMAMGSQAQMLCQQS